MDANLPMLAVGTSLILLALLGGLVLRLRSRRAAAPAAAVDLLEPEPVVDDTPGGTVTERALRAHIRVLEEALASAAEPAPQPDGADAYREQVRTAVRAIAQRTTADQDPQYAVARVAAAIERLDHPGTLGRPVLPEVPGRIMPAPAPATRPVLEAVEKVAKVEETKPVAQAVAPALVEPVADPEPEIVLPVPPPAPAETRRGRRWLRHSAA